MENSPDPSTAPPGSYPGKIVDVQNVEGRNGDPQIAWTVEIAHNSQVYEARTWTDQTFYTYSPEYRWTSAILGITIGPEMDLDEKDLLDAPVLAKVSVGKGRRGQPQYYIDDLSVPKPSQDTGAVHARADEKDVDFNFGANAPIDDEVDVP